MSDPTENRVQTMPERYGTARPRRRPLVIVLAVALVGGLTAWAIWAAVTSEPAIDATLTSYDVVSDHEVRVKISTHFRDEHVKGSCLVRATAQDHTIVGELNLSAAQLRVQQGRWISMRTERRATTATVVRCGD